EIPKEDGPREQRPAPYLDLTYECTAAGTTFTLINYGGDMQSVEHYTLSDGTSGEYQLPWRQSLTVTAGFGAVSIDAGAAGSLAVACQRPPQLTISGMCVPETGVWFTIHNNGGPMPEPQVYTLDNTTTDTFRLGEGGQVQIAAGFGDPVFFSDGLTTRMGTLCKPVGSISGMIWSDVDGNGVHDANEPGLANVMVSLMADGDPVTLKTAADGLYAFDVVPGSYRITVTLPEGFENNLLLTADPEGALDGAADITIAPADRAEWVGNFGYQPTQMGSISGLVWLETHDFGQHDADESGLAGAAVHLLDARGEVMRTARLPMDGHYAFEDLPPGLYSIMVDTASLPAQMFATFEPDGNLDFLTTISLHPGEALQDVEFGIVGPF
ncbi:MAG: hypothetical protein K8J31_21320, partial [Anaerolineae bacterium]|nr:hypothetical protein [Anaerolineae bacterium]